MEHALALLSGFFSLNNHYTNLRIFNPMTHEILLKFKEIRNHGVNCFKNSVSMKNIELVLPQLV
jgi:hypothetical protein